MTDKTAPFVERSLFGGAIACRFPSSWLDVSEVRQVPDHQECWHDVNDGCMLVVEILEYQSHIADDQAPGHFFRDLAEANGSSPENTHFQPQRQPFQLANLPDTARICFGMGYQKVALGRDHDPRGDSREQEIRCIRIDVGAIRLPSVGSDILVTLSEPISPNPNEADLSQSSAIFPEIISSLQIRDWSLFG
jgi:hypothetical protein